jgi:hypothetical protein
MPMDWSNERYSRLYTRDTVTWKRWTWEARGAFCLLLRKVDRSGVLDTGTGDKVAALALMLEIPVEVAARSVDQWLGCGTMVETTHGYALPSFLAAQEARQSDRLRQEESRARRLAVSVGNHDAVCHTPSHAVTVGHTASQHVTPAVPDQPYQTSRKDMSGPPDLEAALTDDEFDVFEHWRVTLDHPKAKPTPERKRLIAKWLKVYSREDLRAAIEGCRRSPHHMGQNDRHTKYDSLELILRDAKHIESFMGMTEAA